MMKIKIKKENIKQLAAICLFWGSLWGIVEATLGYLVHLTSFIPGLAGFIMFPIGFYFMNRAYRESGKAICLFHTSAAAATIKLVDLFLPGPGPTLIINPALAILMEGAVLMIIYKVMQEKQMQRVFGFRESLIAAVGWRVLFILYSFALLVLAISTDFFDKGMANILRFFLLEPPVNAILITAYLTIQKKLNGNLAGWGVKKVNEIFDTGLPFAFIMFVIAVFTRIILSVL